MTAVNRHAELITGLAPRWAHWVIGCAAISALAGCGQNSSTNSAGSAVADAAGLTPVVTLQLNPTTVAMGQPITLTWKASNAQSCAASGGWSGTEPTSGAVSLTPTASTTSYTLTCSGVGGSVSQSAQVVVMQPSPPTITLTASPTTIADLGESTLTWATTEATACTASGGWSGPVSTNGSSSTGTLSTNTDFELTCTGPGGSATQSATVTVAAPAPSVTIQATPSSVDAGGRATLAWSSSNVTSCVASGAWSGSKNVSGSQATAPITATSIYTLTCLGAGGEAAQSATVSVAASSPTVALIANPATVLKGDSSTLTWSAANATYCSASGGWSGTKPTSGSSSTGALQANTSYTLTCSGAGGHATQTVTISVKPAASAPTVTLTASPSTVVSGASARLNWSATNATSCIASGAWSGPEATSGSASTGALEAPASYTLTCVGAGGSTAQSATVSVTYPAPTVRLTASPSTVASGASATLAWVSTNATYCVASGAWSGKEATSGSISTGALKSDAIYTLTCSGAGGSAVQSVTISVTTPAPSVTLAATPSTVTSGAASTLNWSSANATSCTASGGWSGTKAKSGSQSTGALTAATKYTLTCTGAGGSASQSTTVSVTPATTGTATLAWSAPTSNTNGTPLTPLKGYTIYYGTSQSSIAKSVVVSGASTLTYEITGLTAATWYFAVAADAADGTQSAMSNIGSKTIQ